jgi:hypothetical protein
MDTNEEHLLFHPIYRSSSETPALVTTLFMLLFCDKQRNRAL